MRRDGTQVFPVYEKHVMLDRDQEVFEHLPSPLVLVHAALGVRGPRHRQ